MCAGYKHSFSVTNALRGAPVIVFDEEEKQAILETFPTIYESFLKSIPDDRQNMLFNPLTLKIVLHLRKYPDSVLNLLSDLKGEGMWNSRDAI